MLNICIAAKKQREFVNSKNVKNLDGKSECKTEDCQNSDDQRKNKQEKLKKLPERVSENWDFEDSEIDLEIKGNDLIMSESSEEIEIEEELIEKSDNSNLSSD